MKASLKNLVTIAVLRDLELMEVYIYIMEIDLWEIQWIRPQQLIFQDDDASLMGHNNISEIICTTNAGEYDIPTNLDNDASIKF
ncbi:hypothetical protein P8452_28755 [Trifolium repens]|nr:hypothetical protein P8452_28755 [Trifolium repens]